MEIEFSKEHVPTPPSPAEVLPLQGLSVLVVDDALDVQFVMERILKKSGVLVDTATNALAALAVTLVKDFDLIFMDLQMPGTDGLECTKALRSAGFKRPIIALTGRIFPEDKLKSLEAGCNDLITKPIRPSELLDTLRHYASGTNDTPH